MPNTFVFKAVELTDHEAARYLRSQKAISRQFYKEAAQ